MDIRRAGRPRRPGRANRVARISIALILPLLAAGILAPSGAGASGAGEDALLDAIFRIDIKTVQADLTFNPADVSVDGTCSLFFRMRPGQTRPAFHFKPLSLGELSGYTFQLDGETWTVNTAASGPGAPILKVLDVPGSAQKSIEVQRDVDPALDHVMTLTYRLRLPVTYPRFSSPVDDIAGQGNEEIFPTVNTPGELARHLITFRVTGDAAYRCLGSGWVQKTGSQQWLLDSEREVASYTVMYALLPEADMVYEERVVNGIPVRMMAYAGGASLSQAWTQITGALIDFPVWYGPFPMPRGLSVFLVAGGGGMEYFGATISGIGALRHEIHHMYFGTSTVAKTYRDSWFDEAVTSWAVDYARNLAPTAAEYRSNIVSGRTPWAVGFDVRAYSKGAQIFAAMASRAGGAANLTLFLSDLYRRHAFAPFTSLQIADYFREFTGIDMRQDFVNWLYNGKAPLAAETAAAVAAASEAKNIDLTPPEPVLNKYGLPSPSSSRRVRRHP
jgi:hypothetical protein